jgi:hypothetical protein
MQVGVCFIFKGEEDHDIDQENEEVGQNGDDPDVDDTEVKETVLEQSLSKF